MTTKRSLSPRRLYLILAAVATLALGAGIAQAELNGSDPKPEPKPLAQAVLGALSAPKVDGLEARITFTNNLLPSGSLPAGEASPLAAGADGRLWLAGDGRFRLDLRSKAGQRAQIASDGKRLRIYDGASDTVYTMAAPKGVGAGPPGGTGGRGGAGGKGTLAPAGGLLAGLQGAVGELARSWTISGAQPGTTAGRPSYTVRISPKDDGGLLGAAELAWDAERGVPLRAAVYTQGKDEPVLQVEAKDVAYGAVTDAEVAATRHPGAKQVTISSKDVAVDGGISRVRGAAAVRERVDFPLAARRELAGLERRDIRLVRFGGDGVGAVSVYGRGLGSVLVFQQKAGERDAARSLPLPKVNIDGATGTELATALGTVLTFERDGVSFTIAGLVPPVAVENAARGLR